VVAYDTTILPGREGSLTPQVNIKGMHGGPFTKSITVESNAANEPRLMLTLKGVVVPAIEVGTTFVTLVAGAPFAKNPMVTLNTRKKDLQVMDLVFEPGQGTAPGWRATIPFLPAYELKRSAKPDSSGMYHDTLWMSVEAELTEALSGMFRISTNHPLKPEITLSGRVTKPVQ